MATQLLYLRDLPKYENIRAAAHRYPDIDPDAVASYLVLLRVASDVHNAMEEFFAGHNISHGRFTVLMILNRNPDLGLSPAELADKAGVTRATMTGLLDGLERDELLGRAGNTEDRRMLTVRLTDKGRAFLDGILPSYFKRIRDLMSPLSGREQQALAELLGKIAAHVPELDGAVASPP